MNKVLLQMRQTTPQIESEEGCQSLWDLLAAINTTRAESTPTLITHHTPILSVDFADEDDRARKVVSRSNYRMTGKFPSPKCGRMIHWESRLELQAFQILEVCPWVKCYREQPALIEFTDADGIARKHFPDIFIEMQNGKRGFLEIKPDRVSLDIELHQRTSLLTSGLSAMGYFYFLVQSAQIESGHFMENALKLLRHARLATPSWEKVRQACSTGPLAASELIQRLNHPDARRWIYSLVISGVLACDLSSPLTDETTITWNVMKGV
jgi:hypothetical protein